MIAARKLIAGYESHIAAADERIRIAERQIEALKEKGALETLRASELETVIRIEREKIALMAEEVALLKKRVSQLEGRAKFWRKAAGFFGVAAGVAILIVVAK